MNRIKTMDKPNKSGFTLIESVAAMTMLALALGMAMGGLLFALKNTNENDVQSELDIDVQLTMERLKKDLRLSSLNEIFYYPAGPGPYTALSFPMARDDDDDGLFELDADGKLIWDLTVVYHIRPASPDQLVVTTFDNRITSLTDTQRQKQLDRVVEAGDGSETDIPNNENASSHIIFANLLDWSILPKQGMFDAYSPTIQRETVSLGFALLSDGAHTFKFNVAGKNDAATGYKIGLDQLQVSPSHSAREAEAQTVSAQSGATATSQYMENGSWKGNHQLYFPATAVGNSFSLSMENDRWEETNFGADGYVAEDTEIKFDETLDPKDFVVQLLGSNVTWEAVQQTGTLLGSSSTNMALTSKEVVIHVNGSSLDSNEKWIVYNGRKCKLTFQAGTTGSLQVKEVSIGQSTSNTNIAWSSGSSVEAKFDGSDSSPIMPPGTTATTDWIDLEINKTNNYLIEFEIDDNNCYPLAWENQQAPVSECMVEGSPTNYIFGLKSIDVTYPEKGTYTSQIFDTRLTTPNYGDISWNAEIPAGTDLDMKVRSGDQSDLSDASDWSAITASSVNPRAVGGIHKRYIQFQVVLTSSSDGLSTPKLKDLTIDWTGDMQLVNISGTFTKGPEYGIVEVLVDDLPLQSAMEVDLRIYKDIFSFKGSTKRVTSSLATDIRPRNTGM